MPPKYAFALGVVLLSGVCAATAMAGMVTMREFLLMLLGLCSGAILFCVIVVLEHNRSS